MMVYMSFLAITGNRIPIIGDKIVRVDIFFVIPTALCL